MISQWRGDFTLAAQASNETSSGSGMLILRRAWTCWLFAIHLSRACAASFFFVFANQHCLDVFHRCLSCPRWLLWVPSPTDHTPSCTYQHKNKKCLLFFLGIPCAFVFTCWKLWSFFFSFCLNNNRRNAAMSHSKVSLKAHCQPPPTSHHTRTNPHIFTQQNKIPPPSLVLFYFRVNWTSLKQNSEAAARSSFLNNNKKRTPTVSHHFRSELNCVCLCGFHKAFVWSSYSLAVGGVFLRPW